MLSIVAQSPIVQDAHTQHLCRILHLQELVVSEDGQPYRLSSRGHEALRLLENMQATDHLPREIALDDVPTGKAGWRFLGSEILAALEAAQRMSGRVGPRTEAMLRGRGFTEDVFSPDGGSAVYLNVHGEGWLAFAHQARSHLEIDADLANSMSQMPAGYTDLHHLGLTPEHLALLEAMELLTWSVPEGTFAVLTALGQAVREALEKGGYPAVRLVLSEPILDALAILAEQGSTSLAPAQLLELQYLGYADKTGAVSVAGRAARRAAALHRQGEPVGGDVFALRKEEIELLALICQLREQPGAPVDLLSKEHIQAILCDRLLVENRKAILGRSESGPTDAFPLTSKQHMLELLERHKGSLQTPRLRRDQEHWFTLLKDLDELLVSLESLGLLSLEKGGTTPFYRLTRTGQQVLAEQGKQPRTIHAAAVKAITTRPDRFSAQATAWITQAKEERLIGTSGMTQAGQLYARLARDCARWTTLTRSEAYTLVNLPLVEAELMTHPPLGDNGKKVAWNVERLETRGLIERLIDGQIVCTGAVQRIQQAVSEALDLEYPITPEIVVLLRALRQVGVGAAKEQRGRISSQQWAEVERVSGLEAGVFQETVSRAQRGHYMSDTMITRAGRNLLEGLARLRG